MSGGVSGEGEDPFTDFTHLMNLVHPGGKRGVRRGVEGAEGLEYSCKQILELNAIIESEQIQIHRQEGVVCCAASRRGAQGFCTNHFKGCKRFGAQTESDVPDREAQLLHSRKGQG